MQGILSPLYVLYFFLFSIIQRKCCYDNGVGRAPLGV